MQRELLDSAPPINLGWSELFGGDQCPLVPWQCRHQKILSSKEEELHLLCLQPVSGEVLLVKKD